MTKVSKKQESTPQLGYYINNLWSALSLMDSKEEIKEFVKDLFTHTEYKMFAKRLEIARRLLSENSYEDIMKNLDVASHSVASINNILALRGDGFRKAHQRLSNLEGESQRRRKDMQERLENQPFSKRRKTVLGALVKTGIKAAADKVGKELKRRSVRKQLSV